MKVNEYMDLKQVRDRVEKPMGAAGKPVTAVGHLYGTPPTMAAKEVVDYDYDVPTKFACLKIDGNHKN